jgi:hypothetical protein
MMTAFGVAIPLIALLLVAFAHISISRSEAKLRKTKDGSAQDQLKAELANSTVTLNLRRPAWRNLHPDDLTVANVNLFQHYVFYNRDLPMHREKKTGNVGLTGRINPSGSKSFHN